VSGSRPVVYLDANPLHDRHLTGIGRYSARLSLTLQAKGGDVRFFSGGQEIVPPEDLGWDPDQDLKVWGHRVWEGTRRPLLPVPEGSLGVYTCTRPAVRTFPFEASILYDFTPLIVPWTHSEKTVLDFRYFFGKALLSSDAAVAISHSTKADAGWLTAMDPARIHVAYCGGSICAERHFHTTPVQRDANIGLVVSTLEPRKNAFFLLDWFRDSGLIPKGTELWWVGPMGWLMSRKQLRPYQKLKGRKVRFLGVVSDAELCRLYQQAGWSIYASLYEGFGFPVLDALRHGTPVLASGHSSIREFNAEGLHFFDPCDAASLDTAWCQLRTSPAPTIPVQRLDQQFNWGQVAECLLDLARRGESAGQVAPADEPTIAIAGSIRAA
jgi:glycosyltransferase involved in cell wall biosynthesis